MNKCDKDDLFITDTHVFFFGSVFSNFHKTKFHLGMNWDCTTEKWLFNYWDGPEFFCSEQAFMWAKAIFFNDFEVAEKILFERNDPYVCKQLGRSVKGYDDEKWSAARYDIMKIVNLAKFTQDKSLNEFIKDKRFDGKTFVEASPFDKIWGIKTAIGVETIDDESTWKGQNLLGKVITEVRSTLISLDEELK